MLQQESDPSALGFQYADLSENLIPLQLQECLAYASEFFCAKSKEFV